MATTNLSIIAGQINAPSLVARKTIEVIYDRGKRVQVRGVQVGDKRLVVTGRLFTTARLKDEWYDDLGDPEAVITALRRSEVKPDLFTFWQRLPDISPLYSYRNEPEALSAIPLQSFQHWWENQIRTDTRKKIKRPEKRGIEIREVQLNDEFAQGVMDVFNDTPVRRGRRFWHYGKSFEMVKTGLSRDLQRSKFIGAYCDGMLVGFVKLVYAEGRFANPGLIVSKIEFRKRYVNNALIAKSVELCTQDRIPFLTYTNWRRGSQADFLIRHGFEKILMPRYWIGLTRKGDLALKLGLHRSLRTWIPDPILGWVLELKKSLYTRWHGSEE